MSKLVPLQTSEHLGRYTPFLMKNTPAALIIEDESDVKILREYTGDERDIKYLYHYTSIEGLIGIIDSNKLRLTNSFFLNDSTEFEHGLLILKVVLRKLGRDKALSSKFEYLQRLKTRGLAKNSLRNGIFTASFCIEKDLLSQWRAYSDGIGVNIGFSRKPILNYINTIHGKVVYIVKHQTAILERLIRAYLEIIPNDYNYAASAEHKDPVLSILAKIFLILPFFKNRHFTEETEYRVVHHLASDEQKVLVKNIASPKGIKAYIELPFKNKEWNNLETREISQITVGPAEYQLRIVNEIKEFLKMKGVAGVQIRRSKIPLI